MFLEEKREREGGEKEIVRERERGAVGQRGRARERD